MLLALGLVDADWSAFYRLLSHARLDYAVLTRCFVRETLGQIPPEEPYMAVVDGMHLPRSSQRMPGKIRRKLLTRSPRQAIITL